MFLDLEGLILQRRKKYLKNFDSEFDGIFYLPKELRNQLVKNFMVKSKNNVRRAYMYQYRSWNSFLP